MTEDLHNALFKMNKRNADGSKKTPVLKNSMARSIRARRRNGNPANRKATLVERLPGGEWVDL